MHELPDEMLDQDAPPGAPPQMQAKAAPIWCAHGVRWMHTEIGYVADDAMAGPHVGHRDPAVAVGAIPCQPTYASYRSWQVTAPAREIEAEQRRQRWF
jgi:hypothetical protein